MPDKAKQNEERILLYSREKKKIEQRRREETKKQTTNDLTDLNQHQLNLLKMVQPNESNKPSVWLS